MHDAPHFAISGSGNEASFAASLAIAERLLARMPNGFVTFIGTGKPHERRAARSAGHGYIAIPAQIYPGGILHGVRGVADGFVGYWAARWLLREQQVSLVISTGGQGSGLVSRAALARGLPTVLLEPNAIPGRVTEWLARHASAVCTAFDEVAEELPGSANVHKTGSYLRTGFDREFPEFGKRDPESKSKSKRLVVLGGAGGAKALNKFVPEALGKVAAGMSGWQVVHQCGPGENSATEERYRGLPVDSHVVSCLDDAPAVLSASDLAIARGSSITLAELAAAKTPALIVPNRHAVDDHQRANARIFEAAGACRIVDEQAAGERPADAIADQLRPMLADAASRKALSQAIAKLAMPQACDEIARIACQLVAAPVAQAA